MNAFDENILIRFVNMISFERLYGIDETIFIANKCLVLKSLGNPLRYTEGVVIDEIVSLDYYRLLSPFAHFKYLLPHD